MCKGSCRLYIHVRSNFSIFYHQHPYAAQQRNIKYHHIISYYIPLHICNPLLRLHDQFLIHRPRQRRAQRLPAHPQP